MYLQCLTPAMLSREAERLRHMARRARRCRDLAPPGMSGEHYADRLEAQALALIVRRNLTQH